MRIEPCANCNIEVKRRGNTTSKHLFCSRKCQSIWFSANYKGDKNPNFNHRWDTDKKQKQSLIIRNSMNDATIKYKCGSANRGKKFSKNRIFKMHGYRTPESYGLGKRKHSHKTKLLIGDKSRKKFTLEYKEKIRKIQENNGNWIPLKQKSNFQIYYKEANWIAKMWDIIEDPLDLLSQKGIFNCRTNTKGVVRDHKLGRKTGFELGVFPEILRHPCNCQILTHRDNIKKKSNQYMDKNDISLKRLLYNIKKFNNYWIEQKIVLEKVKQYENGKRWENSFGKRGAYVRKAN